MDFNSGKDPAPVTDDFLLLPPRSNADADGGVHRSIKSSNVSTKPLMVWTAFKLTVFACWESDDRLFLVGAVCWSCCCSSDVVVPIAIASGWHAMRNGRITFLNDLAEDCGDGVDE